MTFITPYARGVIAKLEAERDPRIAERLAKKQMGPDSRVFRAWWECAACHGHVGAHDRFCRHCGAEFGA